MYTSQVVFSLGLKNVTTGEFAVYWQRPQKAHSSVVRATFRPALTELKK